MKILIKSPASLTSCIYVLNISTLFKN